THVDMGKHRISVTGIGFAVQLHYMHAGRRHVIHMQKLTHGLAATPYNYFLFTRLDRLVEATQQRRDHMAVFWVKVIVGPVKVGRHYAAVIPAVLAVIAFT